MFASLAHVGIGFDADDWVAVIEKNLGKKASAGTDVGDDGKFGQAALVFHGFEHCWRIAGTVADVIVDSGGETPGGIGDRHPE